MGKMSNLAKSCENFTINLWQFYPQKAFLCQFILTNRLQNFTKSETKNIKLFFFLCWSAVGWSLNDLNFSRVDPEIRPRYQCTDDHGRLHSFLLEFSRSNTIGECRFWESLNIRSLASSLEIRSWHVFLHDIVVDNMSQLATMFIVFTFSRPPEK